MFYFRNIFRNHGLASRGNVKNSGIFTVDYKCSPFILLGTDLNHKGRYIHKLSDSKYFVSDKNPSAINVIQKFEEVFNMDKNQQKVTNQVGRFNILW